MTTIIDASSKLIGISGKLGSGKDYLANELETIFHSKNIPTARLSFAGPLKEEINQIINIIRKTNYTTSAIVTVMKEMKLTAVQAETIVELLQKEALANPSFTAYDRTPSTRKAAQLMGTDYRRAQDNNYWVKKLLEQKGTVTEPYTIITDARFPNEVDDALNKFGVSIRLEIPDDILNERRLNRDGFQYSEEALNHPSETALDDYKNFDMYLGATYDSYAVYKSIMALLRLKGF